MKNQTINRILVPVDLEHVSQEIMQLVVAMSQRHQADTRLLYVISPEHYTLAAVDSLVVSMPDEEVLKTETKRLQQLADNTLGDHSISYSVECRIGSLTDRITEAATDFNADLIVMGTYGSNGLLRFVMGSEAYHVINYAPCPVLTVPKQASVSQFKEILFPVRQMPEALDKYEFSRTIARKNKAHVTVLGLTDELDSDKGKAINFNMAELNRLILDDTIEFDSLLSQTSSAVNTVLQQAEEYNADLIVITADRASNIRHLFVGPFFKQIINQATRPVLCIKPETTAHNHPARGTAIPLFPMMNQFGFPVNPA